MKIDQLAKQFSIVDHFFLFWVLIVHYIKIRKNGKYSIK